MLLHDKECTQIGRKANIEKRGSFSIVQKTQRNNRIMHTSFGTMFNSSMENDLSDSISEPVCRML